MKKKAFLVGGLLVVIGLAVVAMNWRKPPVTEQATTTPVISGGALTEALRAGRDVICIIKNGDDQSYVKSGSIVISKSRFRVATKAKDATGKEITSYVVGDGEWAYIWTPLSQGFKVKLSQLSSQEATNSAEQMLESYAKLSGKTGVDCAPWKLDESAFEVPKNIEFMDITEKLLQYKPKN
jgi:hypothetical protein